MEKPGMTEALLYKDTRECEVYMRMHYLRRRAYGAHRIKRKINNRITYSYEYLPRSQIEADLFNECMKKNGYRLVEKNPDKK